jgi:hypothetical protein
MVSSRRLLIALVAITVVLAGCTAQDQASVQTQAPPAPAKQGVAADHPQLTAQEMLVACNECHMEATPDLYAEWYGSTHGIGFVKCYQCHGTFEQMMTTPRNSDCAVCHAGMLGEHTGSQACWQCHPAHTFVAMSQGGK